VDSIPTSILFKGKKLKFELGKFTLNYDFLNFRQVNNKVAALLYENLKQELKGQDIVDSYCGLGSISLYCYDEVKEIIAIDINRNNIKELDKVIETFGLTKYTTIAKSFGKAIASIKGIEGFTLVLDPPRSGLFDFEINDIIKHGFKKIVYVSCSLVSLCNDLKKLIGIYDIVKVTPVRMFPLTTNFETITILKLHESSTK
jgi:23S rRNA (uracil1939-C5)-methyltransferase